MGSVGVNWGFKPDQSGDQFHLRVRDRARNSVRGNVVKLSNNQIVNSELLARRSWRRTGRMSLRRHNRAGLHSPRRPHRSKFLAIALHRLALRGSGGTFPYVCSPSP